MSLSDEPSWDLLSSLYLSLLDEKPPSTKSEAWKSLGFQGTDPSTDFRGSGQLGLADLSNFAKKNLGKAKRSLDLSRDEVAWFPWAVAGINVTMYLLGLLQMGKLDKVLYGKGAGREGWDCVYGGFVDAGLRGRLS